MSEKPNENIEQLKYPIGKFKLPENITSDSISEWISVIDLFPEKLKHEVENLNTSQLNTAYRPGGWTVKQLVHHLADSHINSYVRLKLTLTEDEPTIKPYFEDRWAKLIDSEVIPVEESLNILSSLHKRWVAILKSLSEQDWQTKKYYHPESKRYVPLTEYGALYCWHCNHHLLHITKLKEKMGWD